MAESDSDDLLAAIRLIAERAGKEILAYYAEAEEIEVREKDDKSPVTEADDAAEDVILEMLRTLTPDIPTVSEEAMSAGDDPDVSGGRFWLVDPLDGTREFLSRNGEFTVNIALIENGGAGPTVATFSETDKPTMRIRARAIPDDGATVVASRRHGDTDKLDAFLAGYSVKDKLSAGSSLKFCLVASGRADLYPRFGRTMEWDTAAGHAVLLAAGGQVSTEDGAALGYGKPEFENPHFIARGAAG